MNKKTTRILVAFLVLTLAACAGKRGPGRAKVPEGARQTPLGEVDDTPTPQRTASMSLVEDGEEVFAQGRYDSASDLFQQAVSVDPTNGVAYYHLALVKVRTGEYGEAEGLIEKAEQLLGSKPEWADRIEDLRSEIPPH